MLRKAKLVASLKDHEGYREVLKPLLEARLNLSFPDPSKFTKEEEFLYAAKTASVFKKVIAELLAYFEGQAGAIEYLEKKERGEAEVDKFNLT